MLQHEGSHRFRMKNGRRISAAAWRETMEELMPIAKEDKNTDILMSEFDEFTEKLDNIGKRVERLESNNALQRAQADSMSGRLHTEPTGDINRYSAEADLWK